MTTTIDRVHQFFTFAQLRSASVLVAIIGLILAAATAAAVYAMQPTAHRTQAILPLILKAKSAFGTDGFLRGIVRQVPSLRDNETAAVARLRRGLGAPLEVNKSLALYSVDLIWSNPEETKALMNSIVTNALALSRPFGSELARRLEEIKALENNIPNLRKLYERFSADTAHVKTRTTLYELENDIAQKELLLTFLRRSLNGVTPDDVVVWPTQPSEESARSARAVIAAAAILLLTGLLIYLPLSFSMTSSNRY